VGQKNTIGTTNRFKKILMKFQLLVGAKNNGQRQFQNPWKNKTNENFYQRSNQPLSRNNPPPCDFLPADKKTSLWGLFLEEEFTSGVQCNFFLGLRSEL
jgi:hypothetical protein